MSQTPNQTQTSTQTPSQTQKQLKLPPYGHILLPNNYVLKYAFYEKEYYAGGYLYKYIVNDMGSEKTIIDCAPYISKSGLSFAGCVIYRDGQLLRKGGLVSVKEPFERLYSVRKRTRDYNEMQNIIEGIAQDISSRGHNDILIYYDNYLIEVYLRKDWRGAPTITTEEVTHWIADYNEHGDITIYIYKMPIESVLGDTIITFDGMSKDIIVVNRDGKLLRGLMLPLFNRYYTAYLFEVWWPGTIRVIGKDEKEVTLEKGVYMILAKKFLSRDP